MTVTTSKCKVLVYLVINLLTIIQTSYGVRKIVLMSTNPYDLKDLSDYQENHITNIMNGRVIRWCFNKQNTENIVMYNRKENQIEYVKYIMLNTYQDEGYWSLEKSNYDFNYELNNFFNEMEYANRLGVMGYPHFIEEIKSRESYTQGVLSFSQDIGGKKFYFYNEQYVNEHDELIHFQDLKENKYLLSIDSSDSNYLEDYQKNFINYIEQQDDSIWPFSLEETEDNFMYFDKKNQSTYVKYILKNTDKKLWSIKDSYEDFINKINHFICSEQYANMQGVLSYSQVIEGKKYVHSTNLYDFSYLEENYYDFINFLQNTDCWVFFPKEYEDYYLYNNMENQIEYAKYILKNTYTDRPTFVNRLFPNPRHWSINDSYNEFINKLNLFFYNNKYANKEGVMSYSQIIEGMKYRKSLMEIHHNLKMALPSDTNRSCETYFSEAEKFLNAGLINLIKKRMQEELIAFEKRIKKRLAQLKKCSKNESDWYINLKEDKLITGEPIKSHALRNIANNRIPVNPNDYMKVYAFQNDDTLPLEDFHKIDLSSLSNELFIMAIIEATYKELNNSRDVGPST